MARQKQGRKRKRHVFTRAECQRGYRADLKKAMEHSWERYAWLYYRIRGFYRQKVRDYGKSKKESRAAERWNGTGRRPDGGQPPF